VTGRGTGVPPPDGTRRPARPPTIASPAAAPPAFHRRDRQTGGRTGRRTGRRTGPPHLRRQRAAAACAAIAYAWIAGAYPSFSWQSSAAVLAPGLLLLGYAAVTGPRRPLRPARRLDRRAVAVWSVPLLSFCALEIVNDLLGSTWAHPTLSVLADPLLAGHPGRSAAMLAWLAAGLALVRR
jgi:hypothetical protein